MKSFLKTIFFGYSCYGEKNENIIFDRRNDGRWQNDSKPATEKELTNSVFLDGDWCWDADPFQVTDETKAMVMDNICYLLNNFLHCSAYENVIFCWVMHEQSIVDEIVSKLDTEECRVIKISLIVDEANLRKRLLSDIANKIRTEEIMDKSIARIQMYQVLDTVKIDTSNKSVCEITEEIAAL